MNNHQEKSKKHRVFNSQSGNVFFYIFLCVALLGALSFAIARGGRVSNSQLTQDTVSLIATELISYADTISKTTGMLRLRGTTINELSFANEFLSGLEYGSYGADPDNEIFNPAGGAVVYTDPSAQATTTGTENWLFLANNEIENVGSTCAAADCSDLLIAIDNVKEAICIELNNQLGVGVNNAAPPTDSAINTSAKYKPIALPSSPFGYSQTIGDESAALAGQSEACIDEGGAKYIYYKAVLPQ